MRRFIRTLTIAFICGILVVPVMEAQHRPGTNGSRPSTTAGHSSRKPSSGRTAPKRNNNNGRQSNSRPSSVPQHGGRPSQRHDNPSPKPRHGRQQGYSHHAPHHHRPPRVAPPVRPHRPPMRPYARPLPPPSFRPYRGCPVVHGILGLSFGTTLGISIDYLYNNGYSVDGYGNDVVYLRNVSAMSFVWPDATLYYSSGGLTTSRFSYSTGYYDVTRYNRLYGTLVSQYGNPVDSHAANGGYVATWFGYDNGYISLEYGRQYSSGGSMRYYTTLTYGN